VTLPPAIVRLRAAVENDRTAFDRLLARLARAEPSRPWAEEAPELYLVALTLEHYYTAAETVFERIARAFEGPPAPSPRWHQELLEGMTLEMSGIRPAVLRPETAVELRELLGFRHFLRHAYAVALRPGRLGELADLLRAVHRRLAEDLDAFDAHLASV